MHKDKSCSCARREPCPCAARKSSCAKTNLALERGIRWNAMGTTRCHGTGRCDGNRSVVTGGGDAMRWNKRVPAMRCDSILERIPAMHHGGRCDPLAGWLAGPLPDWCLVAGWRKPVLAMCAGGDVSQGDATRGDAVFRHFTFRRCDAMRCDCCIPAMRCDTGCLA